MEDNELIDLTDLFDRLYKAAIKYWKIWTIIIVAFVLIFEAKAIYFHNDTYTSSMTVIVSSRDNNILVYNDTDEDVNLSFQRALNSSTMNSIICEDLKVSNLPAVISASHITDTNFMVISATASNPEDAYNVIRSVVRNYGQITKLMSNANMIIIDEPMLATHPDTTPSYLKEGIKGCLLGLGIGFVLIFIYAFTRRTITKEEHVKKRLNLKAIGNIPEVASQKRSNRYKHQLLITNPRIPSSYKEAFRSLAMTIQRSEGKQVFMVTSTLPNEGKSTVSSNLALMLASLNKKVALIDLDLRNPSLMKTFNIESIEDVNGSMMTGEFLTNHMVCRYEQNLDLIIGVKRYEESIELLSRHQLRTLIDALRKRYDYIILDVPPVIMMQDALIVARQADASIMVVKQDYAKTYEILDALDELYEIDGHIMGCVLNIVQRSVFDEDAKGYGYGYGYGKS